MTDHHDRSIPKFAVSIHDLSFRPSAKQVEALHQGPIASTITYLDDALVGLVERAKREAGLTKSHYALITMATPQLSEAVQIAWKPVPEINRKLIEASFDKVLQSHKEFSINDGVRINIIAMKPPRGGGKRSYEKIANNLKHDKSVVCPPLDADDQMCLARCLVYGMLYHREGVTQKSVLCSLKTLRNNTTRWTQRALELCRQCDVNPHSPAGIPELEKFARHLQTLGFVIRVFSPNKDAKEPILLQRKRRRPKCQHGAHHEVSLFGID